MPYDDDFYMESVELDIFVLEANEELNNRLNSVKIKMMEESASDDESNIYLEATENAFLKFIQKIIKKIKEIAEAAKNKFKDFIKKKQLDSQLKAFAKEYGENKARYQGKTIRFFDQRKYTKQCMGYINEVKRISKELMKKKFNTVDEWKEFEIEMWKKADKKYLAVVEDLNTFTEVVEINRVFEEYYDIIGAYDKYNNLITKACEDVVNGMKDSANDSDKASVNIATRFVNNFSHSVNLMINNLTRGCFTNVSGLRLHQ